MPEPWQARLSCAIAVSLALLTAPAAAQSDPYASGREVVADINRIVTPNGVQETFEVTLGGAAGGERARRGSRQPDPAVHPWRPGAVEMPIAWSFQRPWEDYFTVVQWDRRWAGRSYLLNDPAKLAPTLIFERYRDDAIELIEQLRRKYGKRKVVVLGHNWGSSVDLAVAAKRPDLLHAYVGMGQAIDWRENERAGMAWALAQAKQRGDAEAVKAIEALKPPQLADAWLGRVSAPRKQVVWFEHSSHLPMVEEPGRTFTLLQHVLPLAAEGARK